MPQTRSIDLVVNWRDVEIKAYASYNAISPQPQLEYNGHSEEERKDMDTVKLTVSNPSPRVRRHGTS